MLVFNYRHAFILQHSFAGGEASSVAEIRSGNFTYADGPVSDGSVGVAGHAAATQHCSVFADALTG
ncbi:MAG: hypothetical protein ACK56I_09065 [bacterium]